MEEARVKRSVVAARARETRAKDKGRGDVEGSFILQVG